MESVYFCHFPDECSINQLIHLGQEVLWGGFWTPMMDTLIGPRPRDINFKNIITRIIILHSHTDTHNPKADIDKLVEQLPNIETQPIDALFNHMDYMYGKNAWKYVYQYVKKYMKES